MSSQEEQYLFKAFNYKVLKTFKAKETLWGSTIKIINQTREFVFFSIANILPRCRKFSSSTKLVEVTVVSQSSGEKGKYAQESQLIFRFHAPLQTLIPGSLKSRLYANFWHRVTGGDFFVRP